MGSENVLARLLSPKSEASPQAEAIEKHVRPEPAVKRATHRKPGRPKLEEKKKARNFTLCLAPQFVEFIDKMVVRDPKVKGRGRKIRFIIERFIEHERRSIGQMKVLRDSLKEVQNVLKGLESKVKKGEKLDLTTREKTTVNEAVNQVHILLKILNYSPKTLQKNLPREEWAILSFCLNWKHNRGVVL